MIVLDTNVVSELMRPTPSDMVIAWMDAQRRPDLHITAMTIAELLYEVAKLPEGRRKRTLGVNVQALLDEEFQRRVLPYAREAASHHADIAAQRQRVGRPIDYPDAQIAAICRARGAALATRNTKDFEGTGVELIDPWLAL